MHRLKYELDWKSLGIIYTTVIRPTLEYADVIWDNCCDYEKQELEKIQIEAARIASGATKFISIQNLYNKIGWETLEKRKINHKLILIYKMYDNLTPDYLSSLAPSSVNEVSHYNLRNANVSKLLTRELLCASIHSYRLSYENGTLYLKMIYM